MDICAEIEVKILNNKVDIEFLEFPEFAHQNPVQILKEPSIRGGIFMAVSNSFKVSFRLVRTREEAKNKILSFLFWIDNESSPKRKNF